MHIHALHALSGKISCWDPMHPLLSPVQRKQGEEVRVPGSLHKSHPIWPRVHIIIHQVFFFFSHYITLFVFWCCCCCCFYYFFAVSFSQVGVISSKCDGSLPLVRCLYFMPLRRTWFAAMSMTLMMKAMANAQIRLFLTHVCLTCCVGLSAGTRERGKRTDEKTKQGFRGPWSSEPDLIKRAEHIWWWRSVPTRCHHCHKENSSQAKDTSSWTTQLWLRNNPQPFFFCSLSPIDIMAA